MFDFQKPKIESAEISEDKKYGRFVVEPLERGYGTTLGNSLRRIMLSSLPGAAVSRIAVPYTGMIISTRESQESRKKVLELGISQISGGSRTSVGGYAETELPDHNSAQFDVSDTRTLDEVVNWLLELGYIPSFCTACYREGRTGDRFMSLVKSGQIANCCGPNALMTLKEYLEDYASEDTRQKGLKLILKETDRIPNPKIREIAIRNLKAIAAGQRDFRF